MPIRTALALGSGGARGYAHIGVIKALQDRGCQIVCVAGSSMGALVGGVFAAGRLDGFTEWVLGLSRRGVLGQVDPSHTTAGVIRAERVLSNMAEFVGDRRIEDLPVRFTAVAVDLLAGREAWLAEGPLDRAIRASIGMPGIFTPVVMNGRLYVDVECSTQYRWQRRWPPMPTWSSRFRCTAHGAVVPRRHRAGKAPTTVRRQSGGAVSEPTLQRCSARSRSTH